MIGLLVFAISLAEYRYQREEQTIPLGIRDSFQFQSKPISTPMIYDEIAITEIDITIYLDEVKDFLLTLSKYNCQGYACLANHENT
ncbi:hypothetical protein, partial [Vibrio parahaemolyticus]|uniref:hypothetical protein n=1 Tax=Vibrio parahaemolyticus TaxID=670 RepID=UPI002879A029